MAGGELYGSGLRLMEGLPLRVKDLAIERGELIVRESKGGKDRVTMMANGANGVKSPLARAAEAQASAPAGRPGH